MMRAGATACPCYLRLDLLFAADFSIAVFFCPFKPADRRYAKQVFGCNKLPWQDWPVPGRPPSMFVSHPECVTGPVAGGRGGVQVGAVHPVHIRNLQNVKARYSDQLAEKKKTRDVLPHPRVAFVELPRCGFVQRIMYLKR